MDDQNNIISRIDEQDFATMSPDVFRERVSSLYNDIMRTADDYCAYVSQLSQELAASRQLIKRLTKTSIIAKDGCHLKYYENAKRQLQELATLLSAAPEDADTNSLGQKTATDTVKFFLHAKTELRNASKWTFVACESMTTDLFRFIGPEDLVTLFNTYIEETPSNKTLPNQVKLKQEMRVRLTEMGH